MKSPTISLGIPTYKRPKRLQNLLERLVVQQEHIQNSMFEIVVSDNCSLDETTSVIDSFQESLPMKHFVNETNIGANNNVLSLIDKCSGKYLWIVPDDDDFVYSDSVKQVFEQVIQCTSKPTVVLVNYNIVELDTHKVLKENAMDLAENLFFENGMDALKILKDVDFLTGICLLIDREACKHDFVKKNAGEYHSPLSMALACMSQGPCLVIAKPLVILGAGDTSNWRNYWPRIYMQDMTACLLAAHEELGLPKETLNRQLKIKKSFSTALAVLSWHRLLLQKFGIRWKTLAKYYGWGYVAKILLVSPFMILWNTRLVKKLRGV